MTMIFDEMTRGCVNVTKYEKSGCYAIDLVNDVGSK